MPGFARGRNLDKLGQHAQDTAELAFTDVRVPVENLLGPEEGRGFKQLVTNLPQERLSIALGAVAAASMALEWTLATSRSARRSGSPSGRSRTPASCWPSWPPRSTSPSASSTTACARSTRATLTAVDAAKAKWWCTELQGRAVDRCLQLHGGYGYMNEYPIARAFADARITRIYGGTTEIMKEVIGRDLGL